MIVDLAVVGDDVAAALRLHRLPTHWRQVHDGQPIVCEPHTRIVIHPSARIIRAPVSEHAVHPLQAADHLAGAWPHSAKKAGDAAHQENLPRKLTDCERGRMLIEPSFHLQSAVLFKNVSYKQW